MDYEEDKVWGQKGEEKTELNISMRENNKEELPWVEENEYEKEKKQKKKEERGQEKEEAEEEEEEGHKKEEE